jgi:hypothetical protein
VLRGIDSTWLALALTKRNITKFKLLSVKYNTIISI